MTSVQLGAIRSAARIRSAPMTDHARFEQIYDDYSGLILAYAARRAGNVDDATDVMAETFTVAWRRIADVPAGEEARPWLYGVARRVLANHYRSTGRRTRLDEKLRSAALGTLVDSVDIEPDEVATHRALSLLSDQDRELLTLSAWDGLDGDDLAVALGCNPGTARVRLHRARRRFAQHLNEVRGNE